MFSVLLLFLGFALALVLALIFLLLASRKRRPPRRTSPPPIPRNSTGSAPHFPSISKIVNSKEIGNAFATVLVLLLVLSVLFYVARGTYRVGKSFIDTVKSSTAPEQPPAQPPNPDQVGPNLYLVTPDHWTKVSLPPISQRCYLAHQGRMQIADYRSQIVYDGYDDPSVRLPYLGPFCWVRSSDGTTFYLSLEKP